MAEVVVRLLSAKKRWAPFREEEYQDSNGGNDSPRKLSRTERSLEGG